MTDKPTKAEMLKNFDLICAVARGNHSVDYETLEDAVIAIRRVIESSSESSEARGDDNND
jgi:hypothetical protein